MIPYLPLRLSALAGLVMLGACAPGHYLVERADLERIEQRISDWELRLEEQDARRSGEIARLSVENRYAAAALMQTLVAKLEDRPCPATPVDCPRVRERAGADARQDSARRPVLQVGDRQLVGAVEQVMLSPPGLLLEARIDTGADSASLDARDIREFERDGNSWVRFQLVDRETEEVFEIERRVVRFVRILQSSAEDAERRPVVEFRLTLGELSQIAEFTLSDRSHLSFPVLIGRNVLKDVMVVDVGRRHIAPPARTPE